MWRRAGRCGSMTLAQFHSGSVSRSVAVGHKIADLISRDEGKTLEFKRDLSSPNAVIRGLPASRFQETGMRFRPTVSLAQEITASRSEQVTGEVTGEVVPLTKTIKGEMKRSDLQRALNLRHEDHFRQAYLKPALDGGIEMTIPHKTRSSKQSYRLTDHGRFLLSERESTYRGDSKGESVDGATNR